MGSVAAVVAVASAVAADCVTAVVDVVEEGAAPDDDAHPASARPVARMSAAAAGNTRR